MTERYLLRLEKHFEKMCRRELILVGKLTSEKMWQSLNLSALEQLTCSFNLFLYCLVV